MGIGHQDRRPAGGGELGHRRGAAARDHEMGAAEPLGDVVEEGRRARPADAERRHRRCAPAPDPRAGIAGRWRAAGAAPPAARERRGHQPGEDPRALAAAEHQQPKRAVRSARIGLLAAGGDRRAHRIAGEARASALPSAAVSAKEVATARARGASSRLARPSTAFCSCSTVGDAGALGGIASSAPRDSRRSPRPGAGRKRLTQPARLRDSRSSELGDALGAAQQAAAGKPAGA